MASVGSRNGEDGGEGGVEGFCEVVPEVVGGGEQCCQRTARKVGY